MIINSLLNTEDVITQCKYKITHMHCEEYKETRTQKTFNIIKFYFIKNNIEASF